VALEQGDLRGSQGWVRVVLGRAPDVATFQRAWVANDHDCMGDLLGYPPCCRQAYARRDAGSHSLDPTWPIFVDTIRATGQDPQSPVSAPPVSNMLWRQLGLRAIPHLPCRFDCPKTGELGLRFLDAAGQAGFHDEAGWLEEILSWPVQWSALHGIAEIKTPVLKMSARTDATGNKLTVRWEGSRYPEEGPIGVAFPYKVQVAPLVTASPAFMRGLDNTLTTIQLLVPSKTK
jgi:hypothetical protein